MQKNNYIPDSIEKNYCKNMVFGQLKANNITTKNVLDAFLSVKRSIFVPDNYKKAAYIDTPIKISENQKMLSPLIIGKILQELNIEKKYNILQIGSGSGYLSALLAKLGRHVDIIEYHESLAKLTFNNLKISKIKNICISQEDASYGLKTSKKYDCIVITFAMPKIIERLLDNLSINGKIVAFLGTAPNIQVTLIKKISQKQFISSILFETDVPKMITNS